MRLRLIDKAGDACASLNIFNAEMPTERLNVADTVKVQWNAYLGADGALVWCTPQAEALFVQIDPAWTPDRGALPQGLGDAVEALASADLAQPV